MSVSTGTDERDNVTLYVAILTLRFTKHRRIGAKHIENGKRERLGFLASFHIH